LWFAGIVEQIQDALNPLLMLRSDTLGFATAKEALKAFMLEMLDHTQSVMCISIFCNL
jgi:hypothetical protein